MICGKSTEEMHEIYQNIAKTYGINAKKVPKKMKVVRKWYLKDAEKMNSTKRCKINAEEMQNRCRNGAKKVRKK